MTSQPAFLQTHAPSARPWQAGPLPQPFQRPSMERHAESSFNPETLHLPPAYPDNPLLEPLTQRWLKAAHPGPWSSRSFKERCTQATPVPQAINTLLRQVTHVLDIEPMAISFGPPEAMLYAEVGQSAAGPALVCHPGMIEHTRDLQRFLLLKAIYAHFQRHTGIASLTQNWTTENREQILTLFFTWNQRNARPILNADWGSRDNYPKGLARISQWLNQLYHKYRSPALANLRELMVRVQPFRRALETESNLFATLACGLATANTALDGMYPVEFAQEQQSILLRRVEEIQSSL